MADLTVSTPLTDILLHMWYLSLLPNLLAQAVLTPLNAMATAGWLAGWLAMWRPTSLIDREQVDFVKCSLFPSLTRLANQPATAECCALVTAAVDHSAASLV